MRTDPSLYIRGTRLRRTVLGFKRKIHAPSKEDATSNFTALPVCTLGRNFLVAMRWVMAWILDGEHVHVRVYDRSESEIWEGMPTKPVVTPLPSLRVT